jgi:hypothetical protein
MTPRAVVDTHVRPFRAGHLVAASIAVAAIIALFALSLSYGLRISATRAPRAVALDAGAG